MPRQLINEFRIAVAVCRRGEGQVSGRLRGMGEGNRAGGSM
jgi:hypothetical protein